MLPLCAVLKKELTKLNRSVFVRRTILRVLLLVTALFMVPASADSSVWRVSDGSRHIYLAGTIHLLRAQDYPLPAVYEKAYQDSDRLYFETDIGGLSDMGLQQRMLQQLTYQDGRTLRSVLNEEAYAALEAYTQSVGMPLAMMQTFKPGLLTTTLSVIEFQRLGFTPQGVDAYFHTRAMGDGKPRGELESIDDQIALLAAMGEGYESEFVLYSLSDFEQIGDMIEPMISAWRAGDVDGLEDNFITPMLEKTPALYESMLVRRNEAWLPRIEAMFSQDGTEYVLVGAAHLAGERGLLAMLAARGYHINQLDTQ
jgi:uncharacterized protein